jgi:hypothetical protein
METGDLLTVWLPYFACLALLFGAVWWIRLLRRSGKKPPFIFRLGFYLGLVAMGYLCGRAIETIMGYDF